MTGSPHPVQENIEELTNLTRSECVDRVSRSSPWKTNGEPTRGVQVPVRLVLGREAHSPKCAMSPRLPSLAIEMPMANAQGVSQPTHSHKSPVLRAIRDETKATSSHLARLCPAVLGFVSVIHHASPELASGCACFTADHDTVFRNPSRWNTEWYGGRHLLGALPRRT